MKHTILFLILLYLSILFLIFFCPMYFSPDSPLNWEPVNFKILEYKINHTIYLDLQYNQHYNCSILILKNIDQYSQKIIGYQTFSGVYNLITKECATEYSEPLFAFLYVFLGFNAIIFLPVTFYRFLKYYNNKLNNEFIEQRTRILDNVDL